jgi:multicomponent K+:H+ antiporter subunit E
MNRWLRALLPAPLLSVSLAVLWLFLNRSVSVGQLVMAAVLALIIPILTRGLRPLPVRIRRPGTVLRLGLTVMADTVQSNIAVLRFLLMPSTRRHPSGFVHIPLELRDPNALAVLAMIVCITPGTAWAELARDRSVLLLHVLEVDDAQAIAQQVKTRYERPLMEIFES